MFYYLTWTKNRKCRHFLHFEIDIILCLNFHFNPPSTWLFLNGSCYKGESIILGDISFLKPTTICNIFVLELSLTFKMNVTWYYINNVYFYGIFVWVRNLFIFNIVIKSPIKKSRIVYGNRKSVTGSFDFFTYQNECQKLVFVQNSLLKCDLHL